MRWLVIVIVQTIQRLRKHPTEGLSDGKQQVLLGPPLLPYVCNQYKVCGKNPS